MAEGPKVVGDLQAAGFRPVAIYDEMEDVRRISQLQHPQGVVGVFEIPAGPRDGAGIDPSELTLVLDGVQDPGNLGTIIRVADWFGVGAIWCSPTRPTAGIRRSSRLRWEASRAWPSTMRRSCR